MTSSPTPAVLPDARALARKIIAQSWAERGFPDSAERIASEDIWVADAMLAFAEQLTTPPASDAAVPAGEVIDLERNFFASLIAAAEQSKWMPPEYMMNDWVSDCCDLLINGPAAAAPKVASDTGADREAIAKLHALQHDNCLNAAKPVWGGSIIQWAADEISALRASGTGVGYALLREQLYSLADVLDMSVEQEDHFRGRIRCYLAMHEAALATPTDATDGATGGGEVGA